MGKVRGIVKKVNEQLLLYHNAAFSFFFFFSFLQDLYYSFVLATWGCDEKHKKHINMWGSSRLHFVFKVLSVN